MDRLTGRIDVDVEAKDKRGAKWCEDASNLTGDRWGFTRIDQEAFEERNREILMNF